MKSDITLFWAKTTDEKDNLQRRNAFHPLICHLIDVGVAAHALWETVLPKIIKERLAECFELKNELEKAGRLFAFFIGLHDLGKCSPPFALRGEHDKLTHKNKQTIRLLDLYRNTEYFCTGVEPSSAAPHSFVTSVVLPPILTANYKIPEQLAKNIAQIIAGHHGTFPDSGFLNRKTGNKYCGDKYWREAQCEFVETLAGLFEVKGDFSHLPNKKLDNATAMIFAGLTTTADWIGSNADFFKCKISDSNEMLKENYISFELADYFNDSKQDAEKALKALGWSKWIGETEEKEFDELFPVLKEKHRDLQNAAIEMANQNELDAVGIAIIESPMGEGKTEAAMYLADVWNARTGTRGIYFALPTQATSNQMFTRIAEFLEARFKGEDLNVQLMLSHGHSSISAEFDKIKSNNLYTDQLANSRAEDEENTSFQNIQNISDDTESAKKSAHSNIAAAEWFTYRKKGLLVPFGVGTIDQILLDVLQTKHVFVRLFGLAHKTVIIDEVHAYDAYMSTLLERLLEWLAALGSPVVILSATLPVKKRDALIKAYLKGLGQKFEDGEQPENTGEPDEYPRISYATAALDPKTFKIRGLETSAQNTKTLFLEWKDENNFVEELKAKLTGGGGCAAIICNTVDRAQMLFAQLKNDKFFQDEAENEIKLDLLHARFRFKDREMREKRSLARFAKPDENGASPHRPHTAVLISTQIIEQSLDLDFDLMISELAPADLLLQRAGRLQRHQRPKRKLLKDTPTLWLIKPPNKDDELIIKDSSPDFGKSGKVYDKHILLRSWLKLRDGEPIEIPNDIETIIEDVYDIEKTCPNAGYANVWNKTLAKYNKGVSDESSEAEERWIAKPLVTQELYQIVGRKEEQLEEDSLAFHEKFRALTRLNADSIKIICLLGSATKAFLDIDGANQIDVKDVVFSKNDSEEKKKVIESNIKRLLYNSIPISRKDLILSILQTEETKILPEWEKCAVLKSCRILWFDEDFSTEIENFSIYLHSELGLRVTKFKKEDDNNA